MGIIPIVLGIPIAGLAGYVLYSLAKIEAASKAGIVQAWAEARRQLHAAPDTADRIIEYGNALASFRIRHAEDGIGNTKRLYTTCEVHGLPGLSGITLRVRSRDLAHFFSPHFASPNALPDFVQNQLVTASPAYLAAAFFDRPTQELVHGSLLSFEIRGAVLYVEVDEAMYATRRIVRLAQEAEALAARWNAMVQGILQLPVRLGFEGTAPQLELAGITPLGQSFRRGRTWLLELSASHDACELVLRTAEAPHTALRFPGLSHSAELVARALEAAESELVTGAYR